MKKKHPPPPAADRLPAMFVGDEETAALPAIPAQALVAGAREAAGMLPEDLRVTVDGSSVTRVELVAAGLLLVLLGGFGAIRALNPDAFPEDLVGGYAVVVALCAALAWLAYRHLISVRSEYRLDDEGIVLQAFRGTDPKPWITRIPWTEIADYTVSLGGDSLDLRVESVRGYTISLRDRPPRLSTREFIRRFVEQAQRHPRAVRPDPVVTVPDGDIQHDISATGCLVYPLLALAGMILNQLVDLSPVQTNLLLVMVCAIAAGLFLWNTLDDYDAALADRGSKRVVARLRGWLRRVLGIRPT